jgi:DNA helicase-4
LEYIAINLIDRLIRCWSLWESNEDYYLKKLAPAIVRGDGTIKLLKEEQEIIDLLRPMLSSKEWAQLPELIAKRRAGQIEEIESGRKRREEKRERQRQEEEQRLRQEEQRLERQQREEAEHRRQDEELRERKQTLINRVRSALKSDFLSADEYLERDQDRDLLSNSEYLELKSRFVQEWARQELNKRLDEEQAAAVAVTASDILVVARAGAGKTRTLITRALFLQKHCGVPSSKLLLLAFNNKSADEMHSRLDRVPNGDVPHVMTFHALAYALVHPKEGLVYDEPSAGRLGLSREIQQVIDEHLQSDQYRPLIRDLMLMHFRDDWERIVDGGFHLPIDELIEYRSALPRETLKGEYVKSFGERLIANTLFQYDIGYKYERSYRWNGVNYKPDFTVLLSARRGVVIEYFGLKGDSDYDQMSQEKRQFWAQRDGWTLLEFSPTDITSRGVEGFASLLLERLEQVGVTGHRLSDEEIWQRIRRRAVDKFTGAMKSFVSRCRKRNLGSEELHHIIDRHTPITKAEQLFLDVGASVYTHYLERLESGSREDFDGLMWRAVALLADGQSRFARDKGRERGDIRNLRFILVDEFQDFSEIFYALFQEIRSLSPEAEFFCVGDDWQAINGFAGSDLRFFENFEAKFRETTTLNVSTNYRSPVQVVQLGNALMTGRGTPAEPDRTDSGWIRTACLSAFTPSAPEQARHNGDEATPAVLRLVKHLLDSGRDVVMLSRRNGVPWYVSYAPDLPDRLDRLERFAEHVRSFLPDEDRGRVTAYTAHKYKGLEKEAVIILDADERSYPLIHPNWVFLRIFGDSIKSIEAEERRLFYVALTRAQHSLVILTDDQKRESPYLNNIRTCMTLDAIAWSELPPVPSLDGERLEVRVYNAYEIRDQLKNLAYRWNAGDKYWYRSIMAEHFDFEALCHQPWAQSDVKIKVYSEAGDLLKQR